MVENVLSKSLDKILQVSLYICVTDWTIIGISVTYREARETKVIFYH